jgi:hypothetical protein
MAPASVRLWPARQEPVGFESDSLLAAQQERYRLVKYLHNQLDLRGKDVSHDRRRRQQQIRYHLGRELRCVWSNSQRKLQLTSQHHTISPRVFGPIHGLIRLSQQIVANLMCTQYGVRRDRQERCDPYADGDLQISMWHSDGAASNALAQTLANTTAPWLSLPCKMTRNSSPPNRAIKSVSRKLACTRVANSRSTWSPTGWAPTGR